MQIGGTLVNMVVRLVILFATLALVYLFIIKPILETTEKVSSDQKVNIQNALENVNRAFDQSTPVTSGPGEVQIRRTITRLDGKRQKRLLRCVQNANQDIDRIRRCAERYTP
ncbi:MAG: hypothetical protein WBP55_11265 [Solirubrobacterales bacterium]